MADFKSAFIEVIKRHFEVKMKRAVTKRRLVSKSNTIIRKLMVFDGGKLKPRTF